MGRVLLSLVLVAVTGAMMRAIPAAPANLAAQVTASTVTLTFSPPGGPILGHQIEAGSGPGLANLAVVPTGPAGQFVAQNVPQGTYYVRVRAVDITGIGPASNEVIVVVGGGCVVPAAPIGLTAIASATTVSIAWQAVSGNGITYVIDVGSAPGPSDIGSFPVGAGTSVTTSAPNGTYYLRGTRRECVRSLGTAVSPDRTCGGRGDTASGSGLAVAGQRVARAVGRGAGQRESNVQPGRPSARALQREARCAYPRRGSVEPVLHARGTRRGNGEQRCRQWRRGGARRLRRGIVGAGALPRDRDVRPATAHDWLRVVS